MAASTDTKIVTLFEQDNLKELIERNKSCGWPDIEPYQKAFAYSFLINYNHRDAAEAAGRPASHGLRLLRDPMVAAFIEDQQEKAATTSYITKEYIVTQYLNMIPMLTGETDVPITLANGDQTYGKQFRPAELRGVLQELSKTVGGFDKDKAQQGSKGGVTINIDLGALTGLGIDPNTVIEGEIVDE